MTPSQFSVILLAIMNRGKIEKIKLVAFDIDGVMTDASIAYVPGGGWFRQYHIRDGQGLLYLKQAGLITAIVSAADESDQSLKQRFEMLQFDRILLKCKDKKARMEECRKELGLAWDQIAFMGDDYPDLELLKAVGFSVTVPDGMDWLKPHVDYVTAAKGGHGAVREVCELILRTQQKHPVL